MFASALVAGFALLWWVLSGSAEMPLLYLGLLSVLAIAACWMHLHRHHPLHPRVWVRFPAYAMWLYAEAVKAAWSVTRLIWSRGALSPQILSLPHGQVQEGAMTLYAHSITLTPGTLTVAQEGDALRIHALRGEDIASLETEVMKGKVQQCFAAEGRA
jgi:multicomponent Na+:H+ antiporter subunit E